MKIGEYEIHPAADAFPLIAGGEFASLVRDIRERGLTEPIERIEGPRGLVVIDGRNRLRACLEADVMPSFALVSVPDPVAYVISKNLHRRHMNESQRAMVAGKLATLGQGKRAPSKETGKSAGLPAPAPTQAAAASIVNVSERSVRSAREVIEKGAPEVVSAVEAGTLAVSAAAELVRRPHDEQRAIVERVSKTDRDGVAKDIRPGQVRALVKQAAKAELGRTLEAEPLPLPTGPYRVIVADPPWQFDARATDATQRGQITYPSMPLDEICALGVPAMAHPEGCVLWLWTTSQHLLSGDALQVVREWGFTPRSLLTWDKIQMGLGATLRSVTEHCILATRGEAVFDFRAETTLIREQRREHSRKPEAFYKIVEATCPGSRVELFAREQRPGWSAWGAETDQFAPSYSKAAASVAETLPAPAVACSDCEHPECSGVPDCSWCDVCAAEELARVERLKERAAKGDAAAVIALDESLAVDDAGDLEAFDRARKHLERDRPDVRVELAIVTAGLARAIKAAPTDRYSVRIEHGTGSSTGTVGGRTRCDALDAAIARLSESWCQHSPETLQLGAELRKLERTIDVWCSCRSEPTTGRAWVTPDGKFEVQLRAGTRHVTRSGPDAKAVFGDATRTFSAKGKKRAPDTTAAPAPKAKKSSRTAPPPRSEKGNRAKAATR